MKINITKTLQEPIEINYLLINDLLLDDQNPRFAGLAKNMSEKELLEKLRSEMHLDELIDSFLENDYYGVEPLLAVPSLKNKNKFIIVEGNRRLAALKILISEGFGVSKKIKDKFIKLKIPVTVYPNRKILWTYSAFRHINGPLVWDSYSKAVYAFKIHNEYKIPVKEIALRIGDKHATVVKMLNGLRVLEQAQAEGFFEKKEVELGRFYFSHLYTILQRENTPKFLNIKFIKRQILPENPISKRNLKNLGLLLEFLFGNRDGTKKPVIRTQNPDLKYLDEILGNDKALKYLKENSQEPDALLNALTYTAREDSTLDDIIYKALNTLRKANGLLYRYKGEIDLYNEIKEIDSIVKDMLDRMKSKMKK